MVVALTSEDGSVPEVDLADYVVSNLQDPISRVDGVGGVQLFAAQYAMRIWLDPHALAAYGLSTQDVANAIRAQKENSAAGQASRASSLTPPLLSSR